MNEKEIYQILAEQLKTMADTHSNGALYATAAYFYERTGDMNNVDEMVEKAEKSGGPVKLIGYCTDCKHRDFLLGDWSGPCIAIQQPDPYDDSGGDGQQVLLYPPDECSDSKVGVDLPSHFGCIRWEQM